MRKLSLQQSVWLAGLLIAVFFAGLGSARLWDRDEPRNSRASHEMLSRGDWIVPTFNNQLRDHKPILLYWGQMASYLALGESEFSARLPSALCGLLTVIAIALLASRMSGSVSGFNREGFWAAGVLGTSLLFVMATRAATPDACLIAFSTLGIVCIVLASLRPSPPFSVGKVGRAKWIPAMFGYTMLGLAVLAKGPVGIILPLVVVHLWWLVCSRRQLVVDAYHQAVKGQDFHSIRGQLKHFGLEIWRTINPLQCLKSVLALKSIPGFLLALMAAAPWYVAVGLETDGAFLRGFFWEHNVGRAVSSMEGHGGSLLFYPVAFLVGTFPWSLWLIPIIAWALRGLRVSRLQSPMIILGGIWIAVYVAAFSIASTKLPSYITPCYPGAALIVAGFLQDFELKWSLPSRRWRRLAYVFTAAVGLVISASILWLSSAEQMPRLSTISVAGVVISAMACLAWIFDWRGNPEKIPVTWLAGAGVFQVLLFGLGSYLVDGYRSDLEMLSRLKSTNISRSGSSTDERTTAPWLAIGGMEPSWVQYLDRNIIELNPGLSSEEYRLQIIEFLKRHPDGQIIVSGSDKQRALLAELPEGFKLETVAKTNRFLRSGSLAVFALSDSPASRAADHRAVGDRPTSSDGSKSTSLH